MNVIQEYHRERDAAIIMVTHEQEDAVAAASRLLILSRGRVVQSGTYQELLEQPKSGFVATLFTRKNILLGKMVEVLEQSARVSIGRDFVRGRIPTWVNRTPKVGEPVLYLVGQRQISIEQGEKGYLGVIEGIVRHDDGITLDVLLHGLGNVRVALDAYDDVRPGSDVKLDWDEGKAWIFCDEDRAQS